MSETKKEMLSLDSINVENLVELSGWEQKQKDLVKENPFIEITDNATYEEAKKRRTALVKGRTSLENQDKVIASKFTGIRKMIMDKTKSLISLSLPHEELQQAEVKRHEAILEEKRLEKERKEQERIDAIKAKIDEFETEGYQYINTVDFSVIEEGYNNLEKIVDNDFDFEEYDILWQQARQRIIDSYAVKVADLKQKEEEKQERERLRLEAEENARKLAELQAQQEKERLEREEKENKERQAIFEVRKNRLMEAGFKMKEGNFWNSEFNSWVNGNEVFVADTIDFENILTDAKNHIQDLTQKKSEAKVEDKRRKEAALKAEKENKARQRKLSNDKFILESYIVSIEAHKDVNVKNQECIDFKEHIEKKLSTFKSELLNELNNI